MGICVPDSVTFDEDAENGGGWASRMSLGKLSLADRDTRLKPFMVMGEFTCLDRLRVKEAHKERETIHSASWMRSRTTLPGLALKSTTSRRAQEIA